MKTEAKTIIVRAVREKFQQNVPLADFLLDTYPRSLGEASKDSFWGIGLTLEDKDALDSGKWKAGGNLLGVTLKKIREELRKNFKCKLKRTGHPNLQN